VSLGIAITVNLVLLSRLSRGPNFIFYHCIVITGWLISSILLASAAAIASQDYVLQPQHNTTFSQAFFFACYAAGLYFVISLLMIISVLGDRLGYYRDESRWVRHEYDLAYQTIIFKVYILAGAAVFSHVESWNYLDTVFWAITTILTIGLGDFAPKTHLGRSLLFPFAAAGVIQLGIVVGSIQSFTTQRRKRKLRRMIQNKRELFLERSKPRYVKYNFRSFDFQNIPDGNSCQ
jgi:potassium channel subfamily K, other eukaryote